MRVDKAVATIAAALGATDLTSVVIEESPVPCIQDIEQGTPIAFALPNAEAIWELDGTSTLEVTLADVEELLEAIDITVEFFASANCVWETEAPTVQFSELQP